jgi:hypothetical protein
VLFRSVTLLTIYCPRSGLSSKEQEHKNNAAKIRKLKNKYF